MDTILDELFGVQAAPIRYHVNWPAPNDPGYLFNPGEITARRNFYGVSYVPTFRFDGKRLRDPSDFGTYAQWYAYVWDVVDSLHGVPAPLQIDHRPVITTITRGTSNGMWPRRT